MTLLVYILYTHEPLERANGDDQTEKMLGQYSTCLLCVFAVQLKASVEREARGTFFIAVLVSKY